MYILTKMDMVVGMVDRAVVMMLVVAVVVVMVMVVVVVMATAKVEVC